jgi:hypothetical protein
MKEHLEAALKKTGLILLLISLTAIAGASFTFPLWFTAHRFPGFYTAAFLIILGFVLVYTLSAAFKKDIKTYGPLNKWLKKRFIPFLILILCISISLFSVIFSILFFMQKALLPAAAAVLLSISLLIPVLYVKNTIKFSK